MNSLSNKTLFTWIINTKEGIGIYTKMRPFRTWAFNHPYDVFYFRDANEDNGIHVPFKIEI